MYILMFIIMKYSKYCKSLVPWNENFDKPRECIKNRYITLLTRSYSESYGFSKSCMDVRVGQ